MASEHDVPDMQRGAGEPIYNSNAGTPSGTGLRPPQLTPGQESRDPFSSREGSPHRDGPSQAGQNTTAQPWGSQAVPVAIPSDLERGMTGYSSPRPDLNPLNTRNQGLGSGHPLPSPPPIIRQPTEYDVQARPRSAHTPQSQRGDPFSGSPDGSPGGQSNQNLRGQQEQIGGHLRHVLDGERHRLVGRLQGNQQVELNPNEGVGARLRHALEEDANNLVDHIPGAYQHDASHANEGIGTRLRHAAEDYIHDTFPNYHMPALPGRLLHTGDDPAGTSMRRSRATDPRVSRTHSVIDHVVPVQHVSELDMTKEKHMPGSVSARLHATLIQATTERDKYATKAKFTGWALNVAIGLQVLLGSLTTGLSAVATRGKSAAVPTTILGALATLVASYLARARGSNEPELSITRVKDLEQFIRECTNFQMDHGEHMGHDYDGKIDGFRMRFESLLGNANGERKLSSAGVQMHNA